MKLAIDGGSALLKKMNLELVVGSEEIDSVVSAMKKGYLSSFEGNNTVAEFESAFAKYHSIKHAVAFNSGTSAIHASVAAMNAKRGGEVIVPCMTFITSVSPMLIEGLKPVFVDIDPNNLGINHRLVSEAITENTVGILPTHLLGFPCEIEKLKKVARENNLFLIEDCAQAHGARVGKKMVGTFGDASCFSFYISKNMTTGEGGMCLTGNDALVPELKTMRQCGKPNPSVSHFSRLAFNYRMTDLCAAVGIPQLKKLDVNNKHRRKIAAVYSRRLKKIGLESLPSREGVFPSFYKFPVLLPKEMACKKHYFCSALAAENANADFFNLSPLNKVGFFKEYGERENYSQKFWEKSFPVCEDFDKRIVVMPVNPVIPLSRAEEICDAVEKVVKYGNWR